MSTAERCLLVVERRVPDAQRATYLASLAPLRAQAAREQAHVWVFEHTEERGRFIEFTEAADAAHVASAHGGALPAPLWREVKEG